MRALLAATVAAVAALLFAEATGLATAWLPLEEAPVLARARGEDGSLSAGLLYPLLLAPAARVLSAEAAHTFAQALSALFWAATIVPAFLLARRLVPPLAAAAVAVLSAVVPASVYATAAVPDALAVLLAVSALAAFASGRLWAAFAFGVAAALARPWFAVLPLAFALLSVRRPLRWPAPLGLAALAGVAYLALARASPDSATALADVGRVGRAAFASLAAAALGVGVVPWLLAPSVARAERLLLVVCAPALALAAGVLGTLPPGRGVDERPLLALTPLVLALAARAWLDGVGARVVVGAAAAIVLAGVALPALGRTPAARAAGLGIVAPDGGSRAYLVSAVVGVVLVALLALLVLRRRPYVLAAALLAVLVAAQVAAWSSVRAEARALAASGPGPHGWVDAAAGEDARVVVTGPAEALDPVSVAQLTLWNRSVRGAQALSFAEVSLTSGQLGPTPDADLLLVRGTELGGTEVAREAGGVLLEPDLPLHLAEIVEGVFPDGWGGERVVYRRFSGTAGTVAVTLLRADGPAAEATVEAPDRIVRVALPPGEEQRVEIEVPAPQFELVVTIAPAFASADGRQLGAVVRFEYRPGP